MFAVRAKLAPPFLAKVTEQASRVHILGWFALAAPRHDAEHVAVGIVQKTI